MGYKILNKIKLGRKTLGNTVELNISKKKVFIADRDNQDHIYRGGLKISFEEAKREEKLEWAVNEAELIKMRDDGIEFVAIQSNYCAKRFVTRIGSFFDPTMARRFRHYDREGRTAMDFQLGLNFKHFRTATIYVTKLSHA